LLRCAKCGDPICTECAVRHPVGLRCPKCARLRKVPTYDVSAPYYLRALGAGLAVSLACGGVAAILPSFLFAFFAALAAGAIIGEVISRATSHKRGTGLQVVAGISTLLGYVVGGFVVTGFRFGALAWPLLLAFLLSPYYCIQPLIAAGVAVTRLR
jgi:F0F1-type ATP synthase assembly protein I